MRRGTCNMQQQKHNTNRDEKITQTKIELQLKKQIADKKFATAENVAVDSSELH